MLLSPIALRLALMADARRWSPRSLRVSAPIVGPVVAPRVSPWSSAMADLNAAIERSIDVYRDESAPVTVRSGQAVAQ